MLSSQSWVEKGLEVSGFPEFQAVLHELVTPMSVIDALVHDLLEPAGPLDATQQRRRLERILRATNDLRSIVQAAQKALRHAQKTVDGAGTAFAPLRNVVLAAAEAGRMLSAQHALEVDLEPEAGAAQCEAHSLGLVLHTLVGNAVKYAPPGTAVTVSARRMLLGVVVAVADAGPGVSPEALLHLFEPHFRAENACGQPGSGMGLALARELMTGMGGDLVAQCPPGGGLKVQAFLPWGPSLRP